MTTTPALTSVASDAPASAPDSATNAPAPTGHETPGTRTKLRDAAEEFLGPQHRIAVVGVSRDEKQPANLIYRRLRDANYTVFGVNPNAAEVEGDIAYPSVTAIAGGADGAVIVTTPEEALRVIDECAAAGIPRVWLHRGLGPGSTSPEAVAHAQELGLQVIPAGCPNMFGATADPGHRCMCAMLKAGHRIPRTIDYDCSALEH